MSHGLKNQSQNQAMNDALILAALVAMYVTGAEHNLEDLQQDAASEFCKLIELDVIEFKRLGLEIQK